MSFKSVSIIIPLFDEEKTIGKILEKVISADTLGLKKEIIVVNDGSTDKGHKIVESLKSEVQSAKSEVSITLISHKKNKGKGAALKSGILQSTGDIILFQDADLEYDPAEYPALLSPILSGHADVVYGSRFMSDRPHRVLYYWHYVGNVLLTTMSNMLTNLNLTDMETGYKVFKGNLLRSIATRLKCRHFGIEPEITARVARIPGVCMYEVGISYFGRTYKEGKKIGFIDALRAILTILRYNIPFTKE